MPAGMTVSPTVPSSTARTPESKGDRSARPNLRRQQSRLSGTEQSRICLQGDFRASSLHRRGRTVPALG